MNEPQLWYYAIFALGSVALTWAHIREARKRKRRNDALAQHIGEILDRNGCRDWRVGR